MRPKELAQDESPSEEALIHVTNKLTKQGYKPDIIILTQCTCPYRLSKDIDDAVNILLKNNHSGVASVSKIPGHFHPYKIKKIKNNELISLIQEKNYPEKIIDIKYYRRQDLPGKYYWMNGAVYVMTYDTLINQKNRYGKNCGAIILPEERLINIDTKLDFKFAEFLIKNKNIKLDFKLEEL